MMIYVLRRIASGVATLVILISVTFFMLRLAPGSPFDSEQVWPKEIQDNLLRKYELDMPWFTQFMHWVRDVLKGDLRESFQYIDQPVSEIITNSLMPSFQLGCWALALALLIGIPCGCVGAVKQNTWIDRAINFSAVVGISLPAYLIASVLILVFSLKLAWLPPALWEGPSSMILPVITLAWRPYAIAVRFTRNEVLKTLNTDYIRTAHAKGLSNWKVVLKHSLRNALVPFMSILGPLAANLITGSFIVEVIFQIPGMGKHFVQAVLNRDYPLIMGVTLTYGIILILSNLIVDLLTAQVDPRIRLESR